MKIVFKISKGPFWWVRRNWGVVKDQDIEVNDLIDELKNNKLYEFVEKIQICTPTDKSEFKFCLAVVEGEDEVMACVKLGIPESVAEATASKKYFFKQGNESAYVVTEEISIK